MPQQIVPSGEFLATVRTLRGNVDVELVLHEPRVGLGPLAVITFDVATDLLLMSFLLGTAWERAYVVP